MIKLEWKTEKRKVKDLIPADYNPRQISYVERLDLEKSIKEFGAVIPIVVNLTGTIIGGHQRVSIYADLAYEEIDVMVPNRELTLEEEMRLNLRLNKNTGSWDETKLADMDVDMLLDVGFNKDELSDMMDDDIIQDKFDHKKAVEKAKNTNVKIGDVYQLGEHRVMCGSSLEQGDVEKLMGGERANMIYSDPPYNIGLDYNSGIGTKNKYQGTTEMELNDKKTKKDYKSFLDGTMKSGIAVSEKDVHIFYWCDEAYIGMVQSLIQENGGENKRVCMWIKNNQNPTPQIAFNKCYEPCVYGVIGKPYLNKNYTAFNEVLNKEVGTGNQAQEDIFDLFNIWLIKRDNAVDYEHPTQKPVNLHEKALKRCSAPGSIVLDLFGGSGSTMMACEQLKRKSYSMELNPIFVQVIINRFEEFTGQKAKKL